MKGIVKTLTHLMEGEPPIKGVLDSERALLTAMEPWAGKTTAASASWIKWAKAQKQDLEEIVRGYEGLFDTLHYSMADFKRRGPRVTSA
jgi:hypothetical protein